MKRIILSQIIFFIAISSLSAQGDFGLREIKVELGNLSPGDAISFTITVEHFLDEQNMDYTVSIFDQPNAAPWINNISPDNFSLFSFWEQQTITFSGTYPTGWYGYGTFYVDVYDSYNFKKTCLVTYTGIEPGGIEDWIYFSQWVTPFHEQDPLAYEAIFVDEEPYDDYITEWNLNITLSSTQGNYEYVDLTTTYTSTSWLWTFDAPDLPSNMSFIRNDLGQVYGVLTVSALDNDGFYHYETMEIGIYKIPDPPNLYLNRAGGNSISTSYCNTGGPDYFIYYDTDTGPPYNGTGFTQGDSPIELSNITSFQLDGAQACTPYYIAVKASNDQGMSDYSTEKQIKVFDALNGLPVNYHFDDLYISDDRVYSENHYYMGNLIIQSGKEVTFQNCIVYFEENSKVIIEPGAILNIDGATFTAPCNQTWHGIEVWGSSSDHQYTINGECAQGQLELDGATIEHAYNAVTLWEPENWNSTGGIIRAYNSSFTNNRRSVEFMSYQNTHPYSGTPVGNLSSFKECIFEANDDYLSSSPFAYHISMWQVTGVRFKACNFINSITGSEKTGYGIYSMDAGYQVKSSCSAPVTPCPEANIVPSTFDGFYAGICALNSESIYPIYVKESDFNDNSYGVSIKKSDYVQIIDNDITIGDNLTDASECVENYGVGIELINSNGYAVEENELDDVSTMVGKSIGVLINYTEAYAGIVFVQNNEVYKNIFDGLHIGCEALGENRLKDTYQTGLQFLCNENDNNDYDFYIKDKGIRPYQGNIDEPAGNLFSHMGNEFSDYNNQSEFPIIYFYDIGIPSAKPEDYSQLVHPTSLNLTNNCLSNYGGTNTIQTDGLGLSTSQLAYYEQEYFNNLTSYNGTLTLYESLKDGGNTEAVVINIESSWPDEMLELRADLLEKSPHLSKEVLYATADNTDVFPDAVIFEILAANPDEMRDNEFLTYLAEKQDPLPDYYIDILRGLAGSISYKTILQSQLSGYNSGMSYSAQVIIRNMLNDSTPNMDSVRFWISNIGSLASQYQIIDSYLQDGNTTDALNVLSSIPVNYDLADADTVEFNRYSDLKNLQANLIIQGRNIFMLDSLEKDVLIEIADSSKGIAGIQARNILEFVYGYHYCNCPEIPDSLTHKDYSAPVRPTIDPESIELKVFPNPASSWTAFEYNLPYNTGDASIIIYNSKGQIEYSTKVIGTVGQVIWDIRDLNQGVFFYRLKTGELSKNGSILVVK